MIPNLKWPLLSQRRVQVKAVMMYRIVNGLVAIQANKHLVNVHNRTRGHETRFIQLDSYSRSRECWHTNNRFSMAIQIENTLPSDVIGKPFCDSYRDALSRVAPPCRFLTVFNRFLLPPLHKI